jgi:hypothetical protein
MIQLVDEYERLVIENIALRAALAAGTTRRTGLGHVEEFTETLRNHAFGHLESKLTGSERSLTKATHNNQFSEYQPH